MSKKPLSWHYHSLQNQQGYLHRVIEEEERRARQAEARIKRLTEKVALYVKQIERAEREGRDGFDMDKFCVRKGE